MSKVINVKLHEHKTLRLKIGDVVVFDCYDKDWKATLGEIVDFEVGDNQSIQWLWLKCSDGSLRKRHASDLGVGLMRKVF